MEMQYFKEFSSHLNRDMECKVYGHAGKPVLFIPCQDGRFFDFENFHMDDVWSPWIESGQVMVISIDTIDSETWSATYADPRWRIELHERWITYITSEVVPFIQSYACECNQTDVQPGVIPFGCSLGATHAANLFFRRPDLFNGLLALSGIYTSTYGFGNYMDDLVYQNSPEHYLANMSTDHPYIDMYNQRNAIICVGQGAWEMPDSTRGLDAIMKSKGINVWVDYWGYDVAHDWDWWYKQVAYFVPKLLNQM